MPAINKWHCYYTVIVFMEHALLLNIDNLQAFYSQKCPEYYLGVLIFSSIMLIMGLFST